MARFTNQAQLRYGNAVTNSNIAVGEILEVLSATKTAVRNTYGQSDTVTYIVSIVNSGTTPITGISVTDNLGEYTFGTTTLVPLTYIDGTVKYYVNGVLQPLAVVTAGPPLVVSGITVPAGGSVTVAYEAAVNEFAPLDTTSVINNTAILTGIIKLKDVRETGKFLIEIMPLMFIPAGVGLMSSWGVLKPLLVPVSVITVVSLVVVMAAGGLVSQAVIRITIKKNGENYDE